MKAKRLLTAFGYLDEEYIAEAAPKLYGKRKRNARRFGTAAAAILIFAGVFGTAMAVSAQFREMVLSFFHIEQAESVPDLSKSPVITQSGIGGLVKAEYVRLEGSDYTVLGSGMLCQIGRKENGAIRSVRFGAIKDGTVLSVDANKNSFMATWEDHTYEGDIYWCVYDNKLSLYNPPSGEDSEQSWYLEPIPGRTDAALLHLSHGRYEAYRQYYMLYHLDTGETEDFLQGTGIEELVSASHFQWSDDLSKAIITCYPESGPDVYYCDIAEKKLASLSNLAKTEITNAFFAGGNTLLFMQTGETECSSFRYDLASGQLTRIINQMKLFENYGTLSVRTDGLMLLGGRYGLYVDPAQAVFAVDLLTGEKTPVNGFTLDEGGSFLLNPSGAKMLYTVFEDASEDSLNISRLGVLDFNTGNFTAFDREGYENPGEWSVSWFDDDRVMIQSGETGADYLYLYEF